MTTQKAREAFANRFERQVDRDGVLAPAERAQRAEAARRAYFVGLASVVASPRAEAERLTRHVTRFVRAALARTPRRPP